LREFLQLTTEQVNSISQLNREFVEMSLRKQARAAQVRQEIIEWTNKEPLDPMQLGVRYAEIEAINRDLRDQLAGVRQKISGILTDPQKARVRQLEEARRLQTLVAQAECENILTPPPSQILPTGAVSGDFATFLLGPPGTFTFTRVGCGAVGGILPLQP
jgi:hypothetical protein